MGVERDGDVVPVESGFDGFGGLGILTGSGIERELTLGEGEPHGSVPFRDEGDATYRLDEGTGLHRGVDRCLLREERADLGVVAVHQEGRRSPSAGLETDQLGVIGEGDVQVPCAPEGLGDLVEGLRLHERARGDTRRGGFPFDLTQRQAVPVRCEKGDEIVLDLHPDTREDRQGVVATRSDDDLGHGLSERIAVHHAAHGGKFREFRVLTLGHGGEVEAAVAAGECHLRSVRDDFYRRRGQAATDVGEETAGDEDRTFLGDVGRDLEPGRDLVVEAREAEGSCFGLDQQACENRNRRTGRQGPGGPGHGFGQDIPLDSEFHGRSAAFQENSRRRVVGGLFGARVMTLMGPEAPTLLARGRPR